MLPLAKWPWGRLDRRREPSSRAVGAHSNRPLLGQHGEVAQSEVAGDALIDAAELVGTLRCCPGNTPERRGSLPMSLLPLRDCVFAGRNSVMSHFPFPVRFGRWGGDRPVEESSGFTLGGGVTTVGPPNSGVATHPPPTGRRIYFRSIESVPPKPPSSKPQGPPSLPGNRPLAVPLMPPTSSPLPRSSAHRPAQAAPAAGRGSGAPAPIPSSHPRSPLRRRTGLGAGPRGVDAHGAGGPSAAPSLTIDRTAGSPRIT